jgi:hypothetical protein
MAGTRSQQRRHRLRLLAMLPAIAGVLAILTAPAHAHDPIMLGPDDASAVEGPLLPDGTISFALYGVIEQPGDTRGFRVRFVAGDPLRVTVLIPDLAPENSLEPDRLPSLGITRPDGSTAQFGASVREPFAEPFTATNYITYIRVDEMAQAGEYAFTVRGELPARFTVAVGEKEQFGTPVEGVDDRAGGLGGVQAWYAMSPLASSPAVSGSDAEGATVDGTAADIAAVDAYVADVASPSAPTAALWVALGAIVVATLAAAMAIVMARRTRQPA